MAGTTVNPTEYHWGKATNDIFQRIYRCQFEATTPEQIAFVQDMIALVANLNCQSAMDRSEIQRLMNMPIKQ